MLFDAYGEPGTILSILCTLTFLKLTDKEVKT